MKNNLYLDLDKFPSNSLNVIKTLSNIQNNIKAFYYLKSITLTPKNLKIKKSQINHTRRILRNFFENDNFIKISILDNENQPLNIR
jgi:hypothetical protein